MYDESIDLLFEIREQLENGDNPINDVALTTRIINHTNAYALRSRLRPTGAAYRDKLLSEAINLRATD
jgi:hypothetical protein